MKQLTFRNAHATWYHPLSPVTTPFLLFAAVMLKKSTTLQKNRKLLYMSVSWLHYLERNLAGQCLEIDLLTLGQ